MSGPTILERDQELELRIATWLQDGPFTAPGASVDAVLATVGRLPAPNRLLDRIRRTVHGTPPGDALEAGRGARPSRWLAVAASVAIVIGALAMVGPPRVAPSAATPAPTAPQPGASPSHAPSPSAGASPSASPSLAPLPVSFTGTSTCSTQEEGKGTRVGATRVTTGIVVRCFDEASDARVGGLGYRYYTTEIDPDAAQRWYGTATRSNQAGDWAGFFDGFQPAGSPYLTLSTFWLGAKGNAGLQIRERVRMRTEEGSIEILESVLELVGPVAVSGQAACSGAARSLTCQPEIDEPRLSGTWTLGLRATDRPDGSATVTGTGRIENAAGGWDVSLSGTLAGDGRTYHLAEAATGSGLYAGFGYAGTLDGPIGALAARGTIEPER